MANSSNKKITSVTEYNSVTNGIIFSVTSNLINYFSHRCNAVAVTENVKWRVTTIWLNEAQGVRFWPTSAAWRDQGVGMMTALQCNDDWLGGRIMPCSRCLTAALTAKHNKTAKMATSQ